MVSLLAVGFALTGCDEGSTAPDEEAPDFESEQGQIAEEQAAYPEGPYGIEKGSIVANYRFVGFANPMVDSSSASYVQMSDFYNPTGNEVYPEGSPYGAGNPKPKAMLINVSSVWCPPCNEENRTVLPELHNDWADRGGLILLQLADGNDPGTPAEFSDLVKWTAKYDTEWPAVIDPDYKLAELFEADAFPANIIIDTTTMEIVDVVAGLPEHSWFAQVDALLE